MLVRKHSSTVQYTKIQYVYSKIQHAYSFMKPLQSPEKGHILIESLEQLLLPTLV